MSIESDARTVDDLVEKEVARELSEEAPQVRLVSASDKLIEKMRELAMRIPNGEEGGVLDEIRRIVIVLENLRTELCWEMEYNDRAGGNEAAPHLFRQPWNVLGPKVPILCSRALDLKKRMSGDLRSNDIERLQKAMDAAIKEIDSLFRKSVKGSQEAKDFVTELYGRICYLCEKFRIVAETAK